MDLIAPMQWAIDALLALLLLWLAGRALASAGLLESAVLFVGFGLTLALVWVRLEAPDIALAEAAIGAGLTGALLLNAIARLRQLDPSSRTADQGGANAADPREPLSTARQGRIHAEKPSRTPHGQD
ncbi:hypothetical protein CKO25_16995 [Thiocapsa imhoffii]|uniref:MrpA C-terminal/MbhD domain-containing protein n=1 Tax=Thiocapsa imhoffii TaxID=382777 RepID=A0A9X0WKN1_9GAMM|nr:hypothetical protein [Thiocapsa imhoffii]